MAPSGDYFCPAYRLSETSADAVSAWVDDQRWPAGTRLKHPGKYHVTCVYSPIGWGDQGNHAWLSGRAECSFLAPVVAVEMFGAKRRGRPRPVALRLHSTDLEAHAEATIDAVEDELSLPVSRSTGGYTPHLTVAYALETVSLPAPALKLELGPLYEHHSCIRELQRRGL